MHDGEDDPELKTTRADCAEFLATYEAFVTKHYGERCEDTAPGCPCCDMWILFDQVKAKIRYAID